MAGKDAVPGSRFVIMSNAEHMEEIYRPLYGSVSDVLTVEK